MHSPDSLLSDKMHLHSRCYPADILYTPATPLYVAALDGLHAIVIKST